VALMGPTDQDHVSQMSVTTTKHPMAPPESRRQETQ
jgi:hypothetical protein